MLQPGLSPGQKALPEKPPILYRLPPEIEVNGIITPEILS
jgi:hypothetical protein